MRFALVVAVLVVASTRGEARDRTAAQAIAPAPPSALDSPGVHNAVTITLVDAIGALPKETAPTIAELTGVFGEIGLAARVGRRRPEEAASSHAGEIEVPVIVLRRPPKSLGAEPIMGLALRHHKTPSPVWIFVDNIRLALGFPEDAGEDPAARESAFARALGRVIAHEVIHSLAPSHPHATGGLMAPTLGRAGLLGPRKPVEASCAQAVLKGLAALRRLDPAPPLPPPVAAVAERAAP